MGKIKSLEDPDLIKLKNELNILEAQYADLIAQKATKEKLIQDYNFKFYSLVGDLLKEVSELRIEKLKQEAKTDSTKNEEVYQAQKEYDEFSKEFEDLKSKKITPLSAQEKNDLTKCFRKASKLCHPDLVSDEFKNEASRLFDELKKAYDKNDVSKVYELLDLLEGSIKFPTKSEKVSDKDRLKIMINKLQIEVEKVKAEISVITESDIYKHITTIKDWDLYLSHIKQQLEKEANTLRIFLNNS